MKNRKATRFGKRPVRPMPLAPEQEVVLRFRAALMAADVEQAKRGAVEVEPVKGEEPDCGLDLNVLQAWWRGLDRTSRQRLARKLALLAGGDFLKAARAVWDSEPAEASRRKRARAVGVRDGKKERGAAKAAMAELSPEFTGWIRTWQAEKGFGFISRKGVPDVFCHVTSLADRECVPEKGQRVRYQLEPSSKKPGTMAAVNVRVEEQDTAQARVSGD